MFLLVRGIAMVKVYLEKQNAPELTLSLVFWPNFRFPLKEKRLFMREIMEQYQKPFFDIVESVAEADFVAVPFDYFEVLRYAPAYLKRVYTLAKKAGKKVLLFEYTDYVDWHIELPEHAVLFRVSVYRHHKKQNEIVMPYFVEDMGRAFRIGPHERPSFSVGFCGQSQFGSFHKKIRAWGKRLLQTAWLTLSGDAVPLVHARGIFWRAAAIRILKKSPILARIIPRPFYSLHRADILFDKERIRHEYVENLRECPLSLCVRGDANASQRLYETFSAARIPLFIDTDCVLPLEEIIPYDELLIRIPSAEIQSLPKRLREWKHTQTPDSLIALEKQARGVYDGYLRLDTYFSVVFDREKSPYKKLLYVGP